MPYKGHKTITVRESIFRTLDQLWKEKGQNKYRSFSSWINELLTYVIERNVIIQLVSPYLEPIGANRDTVYIKDHKRNKMAEIIVKNSRLYCKLCRTDYCIHIAFSVALPEVAIILNTHLNLAEKLDETDMLSK